MATVAHVVVAFEGTKKARQMTRTIPELLPKRSVLRKLCECRDFVGQGEWGLSVRDVKEVAVGGGFLPSE